MATRLPNGKYRAQVYIGTDESGKRLYRSFVEDTSDKADFCALSFKLTSGKKTSKKETTVKVACVAYIDSRRGVLSPTTVDFYEMIVRNFGSFLDSPLDSVSKQSFQRAVTAYASQISERTGRKRSFDSVENAYRFINSVLAENEIYIRGIKLPQKPKKIYTTPDEEELRKIFEAVKGSKFELPVLLASWLSLRRSEICGLQFRDIDFENHVIHIRRAKVLASRTTHLKSPKTFESDREIYLPEFIGEILIKERNGKNDNDFVFGNSPAYISSHFKEFLKRRGITPCKFHELRHAFVSICHAHGIGDSYVQKIGGWSNSYVMRSTYLQTYSDVERQKSKEIEQIFIDILQHNAT